MADLIRLHSVDSRHHSALNENVMMNFELNSRNLSSCCDAFHVMIHCDAAAVMMRDEFVLNFDVMLALECKLLTTADGQCV